MTSPNDLHSVLMQSLVSGGLSGLILAWANELTGDDNESKHDAFSDCHIVLILYVERSFVVASCNTFAYSVQAWLPL